MKLRPIHLVSLLSLAGLTGLATTGCMRRDGLTSTEAAEAKEELEVESQSQALTSNTVAIATNFTIGGAVEKAASELKSFIQSQVSCADVSLSGHTLTVDYGAHGSCPFNGLTFTGTHEITVTRNETNDVVVDHVWTDLSNGKVKVSGTAEVTWTLADPSRHVVHDLDWTRLSDGRTGHGTGDRVQKPLGGDIKVGFTESGTRSWEGAKGRWDIAIDGLEMRWIDPIPQSGSVTLDTPFDKTIDLGFARVSPTTIRLTLTGPRGSIDFDVSQK
jgi:hypothetical protein